MKFGKRMQRKSWNKGDINQEEEIKKLGWIFLAIILFMCLIVLFNVYLKHILS